jgi:hypothetical protein
MAVGAGARMMICVRDPASQSMTGFDVKVGAADRRLILAIQ